MLTCKRLRGPHARIDLGSPSLAVYVFQRHDTHGFQKQTNVTRTCHVHPYFMQHCWYGSLSLYDHSPEIIYQGTNDILDFLPLQPSRQRTVHAHTNRVFLPRPPRQQTQE